MALASYSEITGDLLIEETSLTNVIGLPCLHTIKGGLIIFANVDLIEVTGFEGLTILHESLSVRDNPHLTRLPDLDRLREVGESVEISRNTSLFSIGGFRNLRLLGSSILLDHNGIPTEVDGFDNLRDIGNHVYLYGTYRIRGFDDLERGFNLFIAGEGDIEIVGMNDLSTVGSMYFYDSSRLVLDGLTASPLYLNAGEVEQLTEVFRTTEDRRLRDRAQAVLMASRGRGAAQIAEDLAVHVSTVRRWLAHWRDGGLAALRIQWAPGKRPLIDETLAATSRTGYARDRCTLAWIAPTGPAGRWPSIWPRPMGSG